MDTGVFVATWRGSVEARSKADAIFRDDSKTLIASSIVRLELAPHNACPPSETAHFEALFEFVHVWIPLDESLALRARELRTAFGLASLDALHVAAAELAVVDQFVSTERPTKPLYRASHVNPVFLGNL